MSFSLAPSSIKNHTGLHFAALRVNSAISCIRSEPFYLVLQAIEVPVVYSQSPYGRQPRSKPIAYCSHVSLVSLSACFPTLSFVFLAFYTSFVLSTLLSPVFCSFTCYPLHCFPYPFPTSSFTVHFFPLFLLSSFLLSFLASIVLLILVVMFLPPFSLTHPHTLIFFPLSSLLCFSLPSSLPPVLSLTLIVSPVTLASRQVSLIFLHLTFLVLSHFPKLCSLFFLVF